MSEEKLIAVSVAIGDRTYRVRVEPNEEEQLRKTVKLINEKIVEFKITLAGKDMQDYISMVLLWYATQPLGTVQNGIDEEAIRLGLQKILTLFPK